MPDAEPPRTLVLMRHAAAADPGRYSDHDRPLTDAGTAAAAAAGTWLAEQVPPVDLVFCSSAVRARQTWQATGLDAPVRYLDELYGGGIEDIVEILARTPPDARAVVVVGHAPTIPATAHDLATIAHLATVDAAAAARGGSADPAGPDPADADPVEDSSTRDQLRSFSACALAVLDVRCAWGELGEHGARLERVRHPER